MTGTPKLLPGRLSPRQGRSQSSSRPQVPSARLALATILPAYAKVSDDEAIEATVMDWRWIVWARMSRRLPRAPWQGSVPG